MNKFTGHRENALIYYEFYLKYNNLTVKKIHSAWLFDPACLFIFCQKFHPARLIDAAQIFDTLEYKVAQLLPFNL